MVHNYFLIIMNAFLSDSEAAQSSSEAACLFPAWARTIGILQSFAYSSQYEFDSDGLEMRVKVIVGDLQGDYGGQRLYFVDYILEVPQCCPTALPFLPN